MHSCDLCNITIVVRDEFHPFLNLLDINCGGAGNIFFKVNTWHLGEYGGVWDVFDQTGLIVVIKFIILPVVFIFSSVKEF